MYLEHTKTYSDSRSYSKAPSECTRKSFKKISNIPHYGVADDEAAKVLIRIKKALKDYGKSFIDFFKQIDKNGDGFISIDEFKRCALEIMKVESIYIDKLFNYMDQEKLGMIDLK